MEVISFVALFAVLCSVGVEAGKFENFVVNVEEITKINTECKQTVDEQKDTINELKVALASNLTGKMEVLEKTNANLTNKIAVLEAADEECKQSVANLTNKIAVLEVADVECKQRVANMTDKMQTLEAKNVELEAKNVELEAKNEALNLTLTAIQGKVYHLVSKQAGR